MKKLTLLKAAIDFAFANYAAGAVDLAKKSVIAFEAAGGTDADLDIWNNQVRQSVGQFKQTAAQKLPSEVLAARAAAPETAAPVSNAAAMSKAPEEAKAAAS